MLSDFERSIDFVTQNFVRRSANGGVFTLLVDTRALFCSDTCFSCDLVNSNQKNFIYVFVIGIDVYK